MTLRRGAESANLDAQRPIGVRGNPGLALTLAGLGVALALLAPCFAPYDAVRPSFDAVLAPPGATHLMGADELGRDVFSRLLVAGRVSLGVGLASVASSMVLGSVAGMSAGYFGGWIDVVVMRAFDLVLVFPAVLLALVLGATLGPGLGNVIVAIAALNLPVFARLARTQTLVVRELGFVEARRALGFPSSTSCLARSRPIFAAPADAGLAAPRVQHPFEILPFLSRPRHSAADADLGPNAA